LAYACLDWMSFRGSSAQTVGVRELAVTTGGPGRAFRITETEIVEGLGRASKLLPSVSLTSAAGVPQLISSGPPAATASDALGAYYRPDGHRAGLQIALGDGPYENSEKSESNIRNRRGRRDGGEDQRLDPATVGARTPITGAF